jgi:hypothetical protein
LDTALRVGEGVVAHIPDLSLVGVLPLLVPPPVRSHLLLLLVFVGLSIATTPGRSGLAIQLALASPVALLERLVLQIGGATIDQGSQHLQVFPSARVG